MYGVSKDTLRRRIKESAGLLIDNKTKKYLNEKGEVVRASDYEEVLLELIRGKGNALKDKSIDKARPMEKEDTLDTHERYMYDTPETHAKHAGDTSDVHARHVHNTQETYREHAEDTLSRKEVKALRKLSQEWKSLKGQLNDSEVAASVEPITLQERWMELNLKAKRSRRVYKVSDQVW